MVIPVRRSSGAPLGEMCVLAGEADREILLPCWPEFGETVIRVGTITEPNHEAIREASRLPCPSLP